MSVAASLWFSLKGNMVFGFCFASLVSSRLGMICNSRSALSTRAVRLLEGKVGEGRLLRHGDTLWFRM